MSKRIQSTRKIKCLGNCVDKGDAFLHPITLKLTQIPPYIYPGITPRISFDGFVY